MDDRETQRSPHRQAAGAAQAGTEQTPAQAEVCVPRQKLERLSVLLHTTYGKFQSRSLRTAIDYVDQLLRTTAVDTFPDE